MAGEYGLHVRFPALPGKADELEAVLLRAAESLKGSPECRLYVVGRSPGEENLVWVIEVWSSREAHAAGLQDPAAQAIIPRALALLDGRPQATELRPAGGKGL
jgi:quinol monooxygenase YgiN